MAGAASGLSALAYGLRLVPALDREGPVRGPHAKSDPPATTALRTPALTLAPGAALAASRHALLLLPRLRILHVQRRQVAREIAVPLGIHAHNDAEMAVANSLIAIAQGVIQVQGTINGIGERCGNANLSSIIPNLALKMKQEPVTREQLTHLREVSHFVAELANLVPNTHQPYVGDSAFAHKGGVHIDAVRKNPMTYEHIAPKVVGNRQRLLVSDHAGKSSLAGKAEEFHIRLRKNNPKTKELLATLKDLENQGYQFEGAEGSFELLMRKVIGKHKPSFELVGFRVIVEKRHADEEPISVDGIDLTVIEGDAGNGSGKKKKSEDAKDRDRGARGGSSPKENDGRGASASGPLDLDREPTGAPAG